MRSLLSISLAALAAGCGGTTGSGLVTFTTQAGGATDLTGGPIEFDTGSGFHVRLTSAHFHFGAIYLNRSTPSSGGPAEPCVLPGIYVGEAFGACDPSTGACGVDLDLLSPDLTTLPLPGEGTVNRAVEAEVWLTGGDINAPDDATHILDVAGTAWRRSRRFSRDPESWPFTGAVTIGKNRAIPVQQVDMPGANPICRQRIVSLIPVDFVLEDGGTLEMRVDARGMFNGLDFSVLKPGSDGGYVIPDKPGGAGTALYKGVDANSGVYQFTWTDPVQ